VSDFGWFCVCIIGVTLALKLPEAFAVAAAVFALANKKDKTSDE
jgi:hypothetical protein